MELRNRWVKKVNSFSIETNGWGWGWRGKEPWDFVIVAGYSEEESEKPECSGKRKGQETKEVDTR